MINLKRIKKFCCEDLCKIENYEIAVKSEEIYDVHHRLEIQEKILYSRDELINLNLYYNRPANELIFLSHKDHAQLHMSGTNNPNYGKIMSEETKQKIRENRPSTKGENNPFYGKHHSNETKEKISAANKNNKSFYGKHHSEESKQKNREKHLGKKLSKEQKLKISTTCKKLWENEEYKQKMVEHLKGENNPFYGKHHSEESKQKIKQNRRSYKGENNPCFGKHRVYNDETHTKYHYE